MSNGKTIFHIMPESNDSTESSLPEHLPKHWQVACQQAAVCFRNNQRVLMFTDSKELAEQLDELLWQFDPQSFVPHNLPGEGGQYGAPVEISWQAPKNKRQVLINLAERIPNFAGNFRHIIDFVPAEEQAKQAARQRYRLYQSNGYQLETVQEKSIEPA